MTRRVYQHQPELELLVGSWGCVKHRMDFDNETFSGWPDMDTVLKGVAEVNVPLHDRHGIKIAVSAHWGREVYIPVDHRVVGKYAKYNKKSGGIDLQKWMDGVPGGTYAPVGRVIPGGFGFEWSDAGAFVNPVEEHRRFHHEMMVFSFEMSERIIEFEAGVGWVIYWTGPDGFRYRSILQGLDPFISYETIKEQEEYSLVVNGVGDAVQEAIEEGYTRRGTKLLVEDKGGGNPCYLDIFLDSYVALDGIDAINQRAGCADDPIAWWQPELCHTRGTGEEMGKALRRAIKQKRWGGQYHLNAGPIADNPFRRRLLRGAKLSEYKPFPDLDANPGDGPEEWVHDQKESIRAACEFSARTGKPAQIEFDCKFARADDVKTRLTDAAEWTIGVFKEHAATLSA